MRPINVEFPSGDVYITMFPNTENERQYKVSATKRGTPYVKVNGVRHELTREEIQYIRTMVFIL